MISKKMAGYIENSSATRAMFEEGKRLAGIYGAENVYDFSLGNPNVAAPEAVKSIIYKILESNDSVELHGYMSNSGYETVRRSIAGHINKLYETVYEEKNIIMTVGAAGGLNVALKTLINPGDEVIVFAPFFSEYRFYIQNYDGELKIVPTGVDFQPDTDAFCRAVTHKTKAVIINTPNNPTGVVYSPGMLKELAGVLESKQAEYGTQIYLISDEPYRELVYDGCEVPWIPLYYRNTIVSYSYSKSLSLPGERIGYLVIPSEVDDVSQILSGVNVANRILGFVNAPSLFQKVVAECLDETVDITYYKRNRDTLVDGLKKAGFDCDKPQGAFYLFLKSPEEDERKFCETAKKYHILMVPGTGFGCPGYVRIAYCVSYETIVSALPAFELLAKKYALSGKDSEGE